MVSKNSRAEPFLFIGGRLCVDFANTVYAPGDAAAALGGVGDLAAFLEAAGAADRAGVRRLRALARANPRRATAAFGRALALRQALRDLLGALEAGGRVRREWVALVNRVLRADAGYPQLIACDGGWSFTRVSADVDPLAALVPVARSAAELIQEGPGAPVRKCGNPKCVLYFYDASRTGRRRWCSMAVCGNRMKVAAHARRAATRSLRA